MQRYKPIKRKHNWWRYKDSIKLQLGLLENTRWFPYCTFKYFSTIWLDYDVNFPFFLVFFCFPFFFFLLQVVRSCYWVFRSLVCLFNKTCIRVSMRRPLYFHFHYWRMKLQVKFSLAYLCPSSLQIQGGPWKC